MSSTEITLLAGDRHRVDGDPAEVERLILNAARGSLLEFAWLTDAATGEPIALNPEHIVMLRGVSA